MKYYDIKRKKGMIALNAFFVLLVNVLFITMERSNMTNTFNKNPPLNQMPSRTNP